MKPMRVGGGAQQPETAPSWREAPAQTPDLTGTRYVPSTEQLRDGLQLTGKLYRGALDGEVRGWLWDHKTRVRIEFNGCRDPRGNGYLLMGHVVGVEETGG